MKTSCNEFMNRSEILGKRLVILGGGGGTPDFKLQGLSNGGKNQNPKKPLDQNLTSKQFHTQFPSHKHFQRNYAAQIFRLF